MRGLSELDRGSGRVPRCALRCNALVMQLARRPWPGYESINQRGYSLLKESARAGSMLPHQSSPLSIISASRVLIPAQTPRESCA